MGTDGNGSFDRHARRPGCTGRSLMLRAALLPVLLPLPDPARDVGAGLVQAPQ